MGGKGGGSSAEIDFSNNLLKLIEFGKAAVDIQIRDGRWDDLPTLQQLFYNTIQTVNSRDYSPQQIEVWSSGAWNDAGWRDRFFRQRFFVAVADQNIVGFTSLEPNGHIDLFFIHAHYQGQGVGSRLLAHLEDVAQHAHLPCLTAEASITAYPFFQRKGFSMVEEQVVERHGVEFQRYRVEKQLPPDTLNA